jgi:hypothetical protein
VLFCQSKYFFILPRVHSEWQNHSCQDDAIREWQPFLQKVSRRFVSAYLKSVNRVIKEFSSSLSGRSQTLTAATL